MNIDGFKSHSSRDNGQAWRRQSAVLILVLGIWHCGPHKTHQRDQGDLAMREGSLYRNARADGWNARTELAITLTPQDDSVGCWLWETPGRVRVEIPIAAKRVLYVKVHDRYRETVLHYLYEREYRFDATRGMLTTLITLPQSRLKAGPVTLQLEVGAVGQKLQWISPRRITLTIYWQPHQLRPEGGFEFQSSRASKDPTTKNGSARPRTGMRCVSKKGAEAPGIYQSKSNKGSRAADLGRGNGTKTSEFIRCQ